MNKININTRCQLKLFRISFLKKVGNIWSCPSNVVILHRQKG